MNNRVLIIGEAGPLRDELERHAISAFAGGPADLMQGEQWKLALIVLPIEALPDISSLEVPVMFVAGPSEESTAVEMMAMGATDWFPKDDLRRLVPAVRRELAAARQLDELKRESRFKDRLMSVVSHEIRVPLTTISGFTSILANGLAGPISDDQHRHLVQILDASDRLQHIVEDLLEHSRIEEGRFLVRPQALQVSALIDSVIDSLRPQATQKRLTLRNEAPKDLPSVLADSRRIGQVLTNLIHNAIKFTHPGGVIDVLARVAGDRLRCEVRDTGIGIKEEDIPKLFQRFTQLDERQSEGAGLGLSIAKAIVEAHGGAIGVKSQPEKGSTFWFDLPLQGPLDGVE